MVTHAHAHTHFHALDEAQKRGRDPTHCTDLRHRLNTYLRRSLNTWRQTVRRTLVDEDALGLGKTTSFTWDPAERLDRFASFARTGADRAFLEHSRMRGVIVLAYNRGRTKAYDERDAGKPTGKTSVVYVSQAVHELTGIIEATIQQMVRAVTHGIQTKEATFAIYRDTLSVMKKVANVRLNMLTQNILTASYNAGKLDAYRELGVKKVGIVAEMVPGLSAVKDADGELIQVLTAQDDRVCPICEDLEGEIYSLDEAFDVLPAHINCRCVWIPATEKDA